jgi:hypothetical protein
LTAEIILLALASAVRPTSLVAVYALVRERSPVRLMAAYVATGLTFTIAMGAVVVWVCSGIALHAGTDGTKAIAEIVAGALALGFGLAFLTGRIKVGATAQAHVARGRREHAQKPRITTRAAAIAGPATHIPGLLYLLALDLIVLQEPAIPGGLLEIGIYNAIWFALPIWVLAICIASPSSARTLMERVQAWTGAHARTLVLLISFGLGGWLLVAGMSNI